PSTAPRAPGPTPGAPSFAPLVPPLPGLGQAYALAKPIADHITTPIVHGLNDKLGQIGTIGPVKFGGGPYAALKDNGDGTYTNGFGDIVTPQADGKVTIEPSKTSSWYERNVGSPISKAGTGVVHAIEGLW
ncbi:MAG TPA: hypothetical protein VE261_06880, partial [Gaiellaceae bacterium]|nr:hypothetical protein [Gaiellaceae bacterium]